MDADGPEKDTLLKTGVFDSTIGGFPQTKFLFRNSVLFLLVAIATQKKTSTFSRCDGILFDAFSNLESSTIIRIAGTISFALIAFILSCSGSRESVAESATSSHVA